jgi:hypothetical protein
VVCENELQSLSITALDSRTDGPNCLSGEGEQPLFTPRRSTDLT